MSQRLTLRDAHFNIIGYVEVKDNGDKVLRDAHFNIKGYYYKAQDVTKDSHFNIVGYGDILTSLL